MILNLDENFKPTLEASIKFEMLRFGGGELHIKISTEKYGMQLNSKSSKMV